MTDRTDFYHPAIVEAFAEAWASIDGKLEEFEAGKGGEIPQSSPHYTGHYEGYMTEADELLRRASKRLPAGMDLWELLSPPSPLATITKEK